MIIVALDMSTRTGFAVDRPGGGPPMTGLFTFQGRRDWRGSGYLKFDTWLYRFGKQARADMIVYEVPIFGNVETGEDKAMICIGLAAHAEMVAASLDIPHRHAASSTVRKHFIGTGRGSSKELKNRVKARCRQLGWEIGDDDNRADAAALWDWAKSTYDKQNHAAEQATALWANAAIRGAGMGGNG